MAAAQLQKPFNCFACTKEIKIQRSEDNTKWLKFELDGVTEHKCEKKKQQQQTREELSELRDEIAELKAYMKTLITQVQYLREELQRRK